MRPKLLFLLFLLILLVSFPLSVLAYWGTTKGDCPCLNFESGYDANTVTNVTGQILSIQTGIDHHNLQMEIECGCGMRMMVVLGPPRYWAEQGVPLKVGDKVAARGCKAQGHNGVIYILAQKITEISQGVVVILRDESGHPSWVGGGSENGGR